MLTLTQDIAASDDQTSRNQDNTRSQNATHEGGTRGGAENQQQQPHRGLLKIIKRSSNPQKQNTNRINQIPNNTQTPHTTYPQTNTTYVLSCVCARGGVGRTSLGRTGSIGAGWRVGVGGVQLTTRGTGTPTNAAGIRGGGGVVGARKSAAPVVACRAGGAGWC